MDLFAAHDDYCERLGPGLLAEPANALSNLGFLLAAALLWRLLSRQDPPAPWPLKTLAAGIFLIGLCSGAYHTFAVGWALLLDVGSIALFIAFYVACFFRLALGLSWAWAVAGVVGYQLAGAALTTLLTRLSPPDALNGSTGYLPALAGLLAMGLTAQLRRERAMASRLFAAAGVFVVSLGLRTYDVAWCAAWPLGTHWLWHLLNALTLLLSVLALTVRGSA